MIKYIFTPKIQQKGLVIYEFDEKDNNFKPHKILHDEPLTDASLETCFNSFHLFTTKLPVQNGNQLFIYQSENGMENIILFKPWNFLPIRVEMPVPYSG